MKAINLLIFVGVWIVISACSPSPNQLSATVAVAQAQTQTAAPTPTMTLTPSKTPTPTRTSTPTGTPTPTATLNLTATQQYNDFSSWVDKLSKDGLISSKNGKYIPLEDYSDSLAKSNYYQWFTFDEYTPTNFIIQANVKISNAAPNSTKAGCGFAVSGYDQAIFFALDGNINYVDAFTRKSNYLDATSATEFESANGVLLTLVVDDRNWHFFVNDKIGLVLNSQGGGPNNVGPAILSGTDEGFGTRCEYTNMLLWIINR